MNSKISVRDVAREAGVSIGSVSRVLNGGANVSQKLRNRVMSVVDRLGYQANVHARGLRMGSSKIIGCMVPEIRNQIYGKIIGAIEAAVTKKNYMLLLGNSLGDIEREHHLLRFFQSHGVDGLIITPSSEGDDFIKSPLGKSTIPMVIVDREVQGARDSVMLEQRQGIQQATEHLITLGHKRIALFTGGQGFWSGRERQTGYEHALQTAGISFDLGLVRQVRSWVYSSYEDMRTLLQSKQRPTAIIAPSTHILAGVLKAIRNEGLIIPKDISVIAIGPSDAVDFSNPPLTVIRWDVDAHGKLATELLFDRLQEPEQPFRRRMVPVELVLGQSCAPLTYF